MRCITIRPPWSLVVADGRKNIENRPRRTNVRGYVLVHSGKRYDKSAERAIMRACANLRLPVPSLEEMRNTPCGAIIGIMRIDDCLQKRDVPLKMRSWASGPYCYVVGNARMFATPMPWRGQLGFFNVPDCIVARAFKKRTAKKWRASQRS